MTDAWSLRPAEATDVAALHDLACDPAVFRYLFDGEAPSRGFIEQIVLEGIADRTVDGAGLWILTGPESMCDGAVRIRRDTAARSAEVTWLVHPAHWGNGLATRMAWTVIRRAFDASGIDAVIAGADRPNARSFAVMRRLGMRFRADVTYPLGPGTEYVLHRDDIGPVPAPLPIPMRD